MPDWMLLLVLLGDVLGLYMLLIGFHAVGTRKLQFADSGRALLGPLAQLCGLILMAALPLSAISRGEVAYLIGARQPLDPDRVASEEEERKGFLTKNKPLLVGWAIDFAVFSAVLTVPVWLIVELSGVRLRRRRQ
jgi:hypothetical protein